uniref:Glycosyltransferase n=1 Tax=Fagus sylvatica TaxID=28930 RepID=A0A2N9IEG7_FAGSY
MNQVELIFVPVPGIGHLVSTIEFAKRLIDRNDRILITILSMKFPFTPTADAYTSLLIASQPQIQLIDLPQVEPPSSDLWSSPEYYISLFIDSNIPNVKDAVTKIVSSNSNSNSALVVGLVLGFFCLPMIDVGRQLSLPLYVFFTASAGFLGLMLCLPSRHDQIGTEFSESDPESLIPGIVNPVPSSVLPSAVFSKEVLDLKCPPSPELDGAQRDNIMQWLDDQPPLSVVFLCFGSMGSFGADQVKEIALGLEGSGHRFLWSLRMPTPTPFADDVLPEGFLDRIKGKGMICNGWAPQVEVLAHKAIGGFVSHCGWNSILESLWHGIPIVTWPIYAEQQLDAFRMVRELGLAVELSLDYRNGADLVMADAIDRAVRRVMDDNEIRKKVKEMGEMAKKAVMEWWIFIQFYWKNY